MTTNKQKLEALRELQKREKLNTYKEDFKLFANEQIKILPKDSSQGFKSFKFNTAQEIVHEALEKQLKDPNLLKKAIDAKNRMGANLSGSGFSATETPEQVKIKAEKAYYDILKQDENFKNYITDLEALQKGVTESGVLIYPLTDSKQEALRSSAQAALLNPVNYKLGDQGSIEYLQSNDNVSDSDKKEITKYLSKSKDALNGISSVMWDRKKGEYAVLVSIPHC